MQENSKWQCVDLSKVWHKGKDVPRNGSHILTLVHTFDQQIGDVTFFEDRTAIVESDADWDSFRKTCHVLQWCYVDDIFFDKTMED